MGNNLVFIVAVAALLGAAALQIILALAGFRADHRDRHRDNSVANLRRDLHNLGGKSAGLTERLVRMESRLSRLAEQSPAPTVAAAPTDHTYQVAVKLVNKGADVQELVSTCGLTRGEAELILRLYRPQPADRGASPKPAARGASRGTSSPVRTAVAAIPAARAPSPTAKPISRRQPARFQTLC